MSTLESPTLHANPDASAKPTAGDGKPFQLKLSRNGKDLGMLCRLTGAALAYQNYCGNHGTPRVFTQVPWKGKTYLQDQEGNYLSWDGVFNCLYMSAWSNAGAWLIEGGRLVRQSDGAVLSLNERQKWPFAAEKFLQALPLSDEALSVEVVAK